MAGQADLLIDVSRLIWRVSSGRLPTGIDRVCLAYVAHYRDRALAVVQWKGMRGILPRRASARLFDLLLSDAPGFRGRVIRLALRELPHLLRSQPGAGRLYLNIGHTALDRPGLAEWIARADVRPVYMVHDLIPITHPAYCRAGEAARHERRIAMMLQTAKGIIGNSQETLDVLGDHAAAHGLPLPPALAAWLGATPLPAGTPEPPLPDPYFVVLGTIEGRKNHVLLLHVWQQLVAQHGPAAPLLAIIGQRGWECAEALALLDGDTTLQGHVIELPRCSDTALGQYLRGARALLFPSFAEGYGMPLVEALGEGTPVIASDLAVFRELAGDIPDYLDPDDLPAWRTAIEAYAQPDSPARAAQIARLAAFRIHGWPEHFAKVDDWLAQL